MYYTTPRHFASNAFTLIELLVVISIVSLLVSILLPALSASRDAARTMACGSNLHQMGVAVEAYKTDTDYFPPLRIYENGDSHYWLFGYAGTAPADIGTPDFKLGQLASYIQSESGVHCPSFVEDTSGPNPELHRLSIYSYAHPWKMGGVGFGNNGYGLLPGPVPVVAVQQPSRTVLLADGFGIRTYIEPPFGSAQEYVGLRPFPRHERGGGFEGYSALDHYSATTDDAFRQGLTNWVFADGHVETAPLEDYYQDLYFNGAFD